MRVTMTWRMSWRSPEAMIFWKRAFRSWGADVSEDGNIFDFGKQSLRLFSREQGTQETVRLVDGNEALVALVEVVGEAGGHDEIGGRAVAEILVHGFFDFEDPSPLVNGSVTD